MRLITTKFLPATGTRGSRIKATSKGIGSITIRDDHEIHGEQMHRRAMRKLIERYSEHLQSSASRLGHSVDRWTSANVSAGTFQFIPSFYNGIHVDFCVDHRLFK